MTTNKINKTERIQIRVKAVLKEDFERIAEFKGLTPTALLHSLVVRTVHEARTEHPEIFSHQAKPAETSAKKKGQPKVVSENEFSDLGLKPIKGNTLKKADKEKK